MNQDSNSGIKVKIAAIFAILAMLIVISPSASAQKSKRKKAAPPPAPQMTAQEVRELSEAASQSRANLISASQTYRESLERVLALQKQDLTRVESVVEKNRGLLEMGLIAKKQLEESEVALAESQSNFSETEKQIESVDHLIAEVNAAEQLAKMPVAPAGAYRTTGMLIRYVGSTRWAMSELTRVEAFFRLRFSKPLPISAFGQTETHNRLGFDHRDAIDVAIHPDSAEGQEVINFLRTQGISFIAIRGAIAGSATGAHIHIGSPSRRVTSH